MSMAVAETDRKLAAVVELATVTAIEGNKVRLSVAGLDVPPAKVAQFRMGTVRFRVMPSVGEQVIIAAPGGNMARAVVIGSLPTTNDLEDTGAGVELDLGGGTLNITNGKLVIDGDVVSGGISLQSHTHPGILSGPSSTGGPQ